MRFVILVIGAFQLVLGACAQTAPGAGSAVPSITAVTGATGFNSDGSVAPGSWIEIYGTNLASSTEPWNTSDFTNGAAPISLDGVSITVAGYPAFVAYVSPQQVNALLPSITPTGPQPVVVTHAGGASSPYSITVDQTAPGIWTPSAFNVGGVQYVGAVFPDFSTFVLPENAIPGVPSRPAGPGDTVIFLGVGFGSVTPDVPAGQVVTQSTQLNQPLQVVFGQTAVAPVFAGLAPNEVGLYQFNVPIPSGLPSGAVPLTFTLGGKPVTGAPALSIALTQSPSLTISGLQDLAGNAGVAVPGNWIVVHGSGFAQNSATAQYPLPTTLAGVSASFNGFAAPIVSVSPQQVEIQVPWEMLGQTSATLTVTNGELAASASISVSFKTAAPAVPSASYGFAVQIEGTGGAAPAPAAPGSNNRPVLPGEFLDIPAIGLGIQKDGPADGQPATTANPGNSLRGVMVGIGSAWVPVLGAALIPGQVGVSMIRVQVPMNAPVGNAVPLVIYAWDLASNPISIAVGASAAPAFAITPQDGSLGLTPTATYPITLVSDTITNGDVTWSAQAMGTPMAATNDVGFFGNPSNASATYFGSFNTSLPEYVLLTATLTSDPTKFATARVLVTEGPETFRITPRNVVVTQTQSISFQALDPSGNSVPVSWYIKGGGGNPYGNVFQPELYAIAANPATIRAVSAQGSADQTYVYVVPSVPRIMGISPPNPGPGDTAVITTEGLDLDQVTVYFSRLDGSFTSVTATNGNNVIPLRIPPDAVEGPIYISGQPVNSAVVQTPPFQAAISPKLRLRPESNEIAQGETTRIGITFLFDPRQRLIQWSTTLGSIDQTGLYSAPASVSQTTYARISACLIDRNVCGWTVVAVKPFRIEPPQSAVPAGGSLQLAAIAAENPVSATWQALAQNISVDANGLVQASSGPLDGGTGPMLVQTPGATRSIETSVTGIQGGMVTVERDLSDWANTGAPLGAEYSRVVTIGNRAYTFGSNMPALQDVQGFQFYWLDTWDITDPFNPVWLASTGVPTNAGTLIKLENQLLIAGDWSFTYNSGVTVGSIWLVYNLNNGIPELSNYVSQLGFAQQTPTAGIIPQSVSGNIGYAFNGTELLDQNMSTLSPPQQVNVQLPASLLSAIYDGTGGTSVAGTNNRLYISYLDLDTNGSGQLFTYDLTTSPPTLLNTTNTSGSNLTLQPFGGVLLCGALVYTLDAEGIPQFASQLPSYGTFDTDATRLRVLLFSIEGMRVADLTNPQNPRISAPTPYLNDIPPPMALAPGDSFIAANGEIESYSVIWTGGPEYLTSFGGTGANVDQKTQGNSLFLAEALSGPPGEAVDTKIFKVYDLTNNSPQLIGYYEDPTQSASSLALINSNYALLACDNDVVVLDISNPATPKKVASLPTTGMATAVAGSRAFVGTITNNNPELLTLDVSNPAVPVVLATTPLESPTAGAAINGTTLAIPSGPDGLYLYDISNPVAPMKLWHSASGFTAWEAVWSGNLLYVASDIGGLAIWDASNPRSPVLVGINDLTGYQAHTPVAYTILVSGNIAWVGTLNGAAVFGLDVRDPTHPRIIDLVVYSLSLNTLVNTLGVVGNNLMVGGYFESLSMKLVSVSSPGDVIRPLPPQTTAADFSSPIQVTATGTETSSITADRDQHRRSLGRGKFQRVLSRAKLNSP